ncbi:hypothetical protein FQZ97_1232100 [compost metagenome]
MCDGSTAPSRPGNQARPSESTMPTSSAAMNAPRTEPTPPTTTTTKARISTSSPMPTCTDISGASAAPASPDKAAPSAKMAVNSHRTFTPIICTISRFEAPARTHMPTRVRATIQ